jgi:hypothetical protein
MTHAVVWIDHKQARIFHVHPEAADESASTRAELLGLSRPQSNFLRVFPPE